MAKPNDTDKGVIFNIDLTGKINDSAAGKLKLIVKLLIGTDIYTNKIIIYGCKNISLNDCTDRAHFNEKIGTLTLTTINQVGVSTLEIKKTDADLVNIKHNTDTAFDVKFFPADKTKIYILIKGCSNDACESRNDFYVGGIYSYICKNNLFNR